MVEMQEERARAQAIVFLSAGVAVCGMLAVLMVTAVIACAFASHLLLALGLLAAFYLLARLFFMLSCRVCCNVGTPLPAPASSLTGTANVWEKKLLENA